MQLLMNEMVGLANYRKVSMNVINKIANKMTVKAFLHKAALMAVLGLVLSLPQVANAVDLNKIRFTKLPGDKVQINLETSGPVSKPGVFSTNDPARIAFDFFGMKKVFAESLIKVGVGAVDSIVTVATDDRTRVVLNLVDNAPYTTEVTDNGFVVTINSISGKTAKLGNVAPKPFAKQPEIVSNKKVQKVDFRRSDNGGGKVIVDLSDPLTSVDVSEQSGEIIVDFQSSSLEPGLEKRLDVADFATPVSTVDVFQNGENVRMILVPNGRYQQISYQNEGVYTVIVDPYVETEEDKEKADENGYLGERLSINFQRIDVRSALAVISDFTGLNIVTSDDVQGELTLNLKDVPWDQALEVILETKGLAKRENGSVIWVAPADTIAKRQAEQLKANKATSLLEPSITEIIQVNYAKAIDLIPLLKPEDSISKDDLAGASRSDNGLLVVDKSSEDGAGDSLSKRLEITADERTNSLLVTTTATNMLVIKNLIKQLDKPVRQVMIETRIVEAIDTFSKELGVRLGFQRVAQNARFPGSSDSNFADTSISSGTLAGANAIDASLVDDADGVANASGGNGLNVDLGASAIGTLQAASYALQLFKAGKGYANIISLELSALEADNKGKIVASPRLVTASQQKASIKQGEERVFARNGSDGEALVKEAVLQLEVTPQITPDDRVILDVKITQDFFVSEFVVNKKEILTQVLVENGETIVIGGIYQESSSNTVTKVPLLGDLPLLGNLFKKKSNVKNRTELIIFLTPKIINPALNLG